MALSIPALNVVSLPGARERRARAFVDLDDRVSVEPVQPGVLIVCSPSIQRASVVNHLARRLHGNRNAVLTAFPAPSGASGSIPVACELAVQLGIAPPADVFACAEALAKEISERSLRVVASLPKEGTWDFAVLSELSKIAGQNTLLAFVTSDTASAFDASISEGGTIESTTFVLDADLNDGERLRWLSGIAEEVWANFSRADLDSLETWWSVARRVSPTRTPTLDALSDEARRLLESLVLVGRSIPVANVAAAGGALLLEELVTRGAVVQNEVTVTVLPWARTLLVGVDVHASGEEAAKLLIGPGTTPDPWAYARAAELLLASGHVEEADAAMDRAAREASDPKAAREIGRAWLDALESVRGDQGFLLRVRASERALEIGEPREAQFCAESASAIRPDDPRVALLMGRALTQLGDLVAARISLNKALSLAKDPELQASCFAELAEGSYLAGAFAEATACGERALALATSSAVRLATRNTMGKVLLAGGRWREADEHFATDALEAAASADRASELRARVNRAIALLSEGNQDNARELLERVRADGERYGSSRAIAHAHLNLGVIAYGQRDYGAALAHWEATVRFPQAVLGRVMALTAITNLAEARLFLGLVSQAEHITTFGQRLLVSSGVSSSHVRAAHLKRVAAQIALARGNTGSARREIESALLNADASNDRHGIDMATIIAVRVALDEGDLRNAEARLAQSAKLAKSARAKAEFAILTAHHLRAAGRPALEAANDALELASESKEADLLAEVFALLTVLHRDAGDVPTARAYLGRALNLRDQVAARLAPEVRAAFFAKAENVTLSRLQASLSKQEIEEEIAPSIRSLARQDTGTTRELVGDDPQIRALNAAIRKVARSNATVLIRGESGTGKELVAEALHRASDWASGPLVSVNCSALVETLLLSELFGHEKGAFTGASARRRGRFELAEGGTLFLDEIGDISPRTQVALLRVLQEKTFERVGGTQPVKANVRVVCATHRDLKAMVERGEFREDLYYRLRGITLEVPALRARMGDLPKIADHLLARIAGERGETPKTLERDAVDLLCRYKWPGNIRELENVLRAVSLFAETSSIGVGDLIDNVEDLREIAQSGPVSQMPPSLSVRGSLLPPPPASVSLSEVEGGEEDSAGQLPEEESSVTSAAYACVRHGTVSLSDMKRQIERDCIARALEETQGNITRAATLLGMKRPRLSQLVKQYGLSAYSEGNP